MNTRNHNRTDKTLGALAAVVLFLVFLAVVVGIRLLQAGGDWPCAFSQDPPLCVAVKGVDR